MLQLARFPNIAYSSFNGPLVKVHDRNDSFKHKGCLFSSLISEELELLGSSPPRMCHVSFKALRSHVNMLK